MAKLVSVLIRDRNHETLLELTNQQMFIVLGALGADPDSMEELELATHRFLTSDANDNFLGSAPGSVTTTQYCECRPDYAIDLPGRVLTFDNDYPEPDRNGFVRIEIQPHEEKAMAAHAPPVFAAEYHLAPEWEIARASSQWRVHADRRRHSRDCWHRAGRELMQEKFSSTIAQEICQDRYGGVHKKTNGKGKGKIRLPKLAEQSAHLLCDEVLDTEALRIHARWLLRARPELDGGTIREYLIGDVFHIETDLASREEQWLVTGQQPPSRSIGAVAYRFGGVGPHEFYLRFRLAEHLIQVGLARCDESKDEPLRLDLLISMLEQKKEQWLTTREHKDFIGLTPIEIIDSERQRIPLTLTDNATPEPCNCPLCQLSGIEDVVTFWHIDDGWLPPDFLFSKYLTVESFLEIESWKSAQRTEMFGEECEAFAAGQTLEGPMPAGVTFSVTRLAPESPLNTPFILLFDLGACLSDLLDKLRQTYADSLDIDSWLEHFKTIRQIVQEDSGIVALSDPVHRLETKLMQVQKSDSSLQVECDSVRKCLSALTRFHDADITAG